MTLRVSDSIKIGPFRLRLSVPLGKGRTWAGVSARAGRGRIGVSEPLGGRKRGRQ